MLNRFPNFSILLYAPLYLDKSGETQIKAQLRRAILHAIGMRELKPGNPLPSIRTFTETLKINSNTILKVVTELQNEGFLETLKGSGIFVAKSNEVKELVAFYRNAKPLMRDTMKKVQNAGYLPVLFAKMFHEESLVNEITEPSIVFTERSKSLAVVSGIDIKTARNMLKKKNHVRFLITTFFYYVQLKEVIKNKNVHLTFISFSLEKTLQKTGKNCTVIANQTDYKIFNDFFIHKTSEKEQLPELILYDEMIHLPDTVREKQNVFISPELWDDLPPAQRKMMQPVPFFLDTRTLSDFRESLGIIPKII